MLLGALASIIAQEKQKPAFIYTKRKASILGSVRAPHGYDTVKAMQHCSEFLDTFGGHAPASGFETAPENEEGLRTCLVEYFRKNK
jgi:single-stranded-DNA-specific exonuclease